MSENTQTRFFPCPMGTLAITGGKQPPLMVVGWLVDESMAGPSRLLAADQATEQLVEIHGECRLGFPRVQP